MIRTERLLLRPWRDDDVEPFIALNADPIAFGFDTFGLAEIISMTTPSNVRSQRVMERLGMRRDPLADFEHPNVPIGHPVRPHWLFRLQRS